MADVNENGQGSIRLADLRRILLAPCLAPFGLFLATKKPLKSSLRQRLGRRVYATSSETEKTSPYRMPDESESSSKVWPGLTGVESSDRAGLPRSGGSVSDEE